MRTIALLLATLCLLSCRNGAAQIPSTEAQVDTSDVNTHTLDEDIGAMLLIGFRGQSVDQCEHIVRDLTELHVGSVILFDYDSPTGQRGRNIADTAQVRQLCSQLRHLAPQLLIGIDQEGGRVQRLAPRHGFASIGSPAQTSLQGDDSVRYAARLTATMLRHLGINLNFAPVADVNVNPKCPVIGGLGRSFSANHRRVATCCDIWLREQTNQHIASCMKHFPGHGSATGDTHRGVVDVSKTWQQRELEPYKKLIATGTVPMVMTAHVVNRRLDPTGLPASLSPSITSLLRDSMGFDGVIVTDDLAMGAITQQYTLEQTIAMAIAAGADLLCLSNNGATYEPNLASQAVAIIRALVDNGTVSAERIAQSAQRVRKLQAAFSY